MLQLMAESLEGLELLRERLQRRWSLMQETLVLFLGQEDLLEKG